MKISKQIMRIVLTATIVSSALAAPKAELWPRWEKHDPQGSYSPDHSAWTAFLKQHLSERAGIVLVDYGAASSAKGEVDQYLAALAQVPIEEINRAEQRAFWINLYNALTVKVILDNYPIASIRDISAGFLSSGPWGEERFKLAGENLSLDDIEHRILRPIWRDARLHYAVNCASIGCPNLAATAFTPMNTEQLLEKGARAYVNHPRGATVKDGKLVVSSIYEWFKEDFDGNDDGIIAHLKKYADEPLRSKLDTVSSISNDHYDWSLNKK